MIWKLHIKTIIRITCARIKNIKWNWVNSGSGHDCPSLTGFALTGIHNQFHSLLSPFTIIDNFIEHAFWKWSKCVRKGDMDGEKTEHVCKQGRYVRCVWPLFLATPCTYGWPGALQEWTQLQYKDHAWGSGNKASVKDVCDL